MKGTKLFPIHILIKDLSFMIIYWLLIKYLFIEINLQSITEDTNAIDLMLGALYYNIITIVISLVSYFPIVKGVQEIKLPVKFEILLTGFSLTLTTPLFYFIINGWKHNDYYALKPEIFAWMLCFFISILFYYLVNIWDNKASRCN